MKNIYSIIKKAKKNLENKDVVVIPTETVYGLAGNAYSDKAVRKIYKIKKRPFKNPLIVHYHSLHDFSKDCVSNKSFQILYKKFCPGPLTFVVFLKKKSKISKLTNANKKTIAVRFPKNKITRELLSKIEFPLAAPSANISTKLSPVCANDVRDDLGKKIKLIIDGGKSKIGLESTIVDLSGRIRVLRPGSITIKDLEKVLKTKITFKNKFREFKSPGQSRLHYSPGIPVRLNAKFPKKNEAFIKLSNKKKVKNYFALSKNGNLKEAAKNLFSVLRLIKKKGYKAIAISKIPNHGIGLAINDRLKKASNK